MPSWSRSSPDQLFEGLPPCFRKMRWASAWVGKLEQLQSLASQAYSRPSLAGGAVTAAAGGGTAPGPETEKERTGGSSMPFGATPVCPCKRSKKPAPAIVAVPDTAVK